MNRWCPPLGGLSAFSTYTTLSVILTWPLILGLSSDVPGDLGDSLLNMWILAWGAEHLPSLLTGAISWSDYWNANIFHPHPLALSLSEHLFGQVLQILPIYWLTGNIILCYNLLFISTFVLSGFGTYLLVRDLTGDRRAAFLAGLIFGFLPYRIAAIPHLQVMSSQWMPLALWGFNRFVTTGSRKALAGGTAALVMQNWSCGYYLLFFAPFVPLFVLHRMWTTRTLDSARTWGGLGAAAAVTVISTLPFLLPYREAQELFGFERSLGEVYFYSANFLSYLTVSESVRLYADILRANLGAEQETFLGFAPLLLAVTALTAALTISDSSARPPAVSRTKRVAIAVIGVATAIQFIALISVVLFGGFEIDLFGIEIRARTPVRTALQLTVLFGLLLALSPTARVRSMRVVRSQVAIFAVLTVLAVWLSFGPNYGLYALLYEHVPGFNGLRVPARYAMIAGLFLAVLGGYGMRWLLEQFKGPAAQTFLLPCITILVLAEGVAVPIEINRAWTGGQKVPPSRVFPAADAPPVYGRIAALPAGSAITELPIGDDAWEIRYVYYSAAHWKPIVNGYSGNFPPGFKARVVRLQRFRDDPQAAWQTLLDSKSTHVVVHRNAFLSIDDANAVESWLTSHGARELERFPDGDVLLALSSGGFDRAKF